MGKFIDVLAIGAHPDDVDLICGGTIAKMTSHSRSVVIVDLTRGEMGSRGTPEEREREARVAADKLGVRDRFSLDLGDGVLENTSDNRRKLIEIIRNYRPTLILTHHWTDLHPDHAQAGQMIRDIMYPVGFARYPAGGEPFRPNEVLFFMGHTPFVPDFIVDIDDFHDQKKAAIRCFASQFGERDVEDVPTGISEPGFMEMIEARARYFGSLIGRTFGEPFAVTRPVPMYDPVEHYERFPKIFSSKSWHSHRLRSDSSRGSKPSETNVDDLEVKE